MEIIEPEKEPKEVAEILDERLVGKTRRKKLEEFLVHWKNKGIEEATWISKEKLAHRDRPVIARKGANS